MTQFENYDLNDLKIYTVDTLQAGSQVNHGVIISCWFGRV